VVCVSHLGSNCCVSRYPNYDWTPGLAEGEMTTADILAVQHSSSDRGPDQQWDTDLNFVSVSGRLGGAGGHAVLLPRSYSRPHETPMLRHAACRGNNFAIVGTYIFVAVASSETEVSAKAQTI